jgi:hypothetical protein
MVPTKSFGKHVPPHSRLCFLPQGCTVHEVAERCREAALEFMAGTNGGWSRKDLAHWLVGPYRHAVSATSMSAKRTKTCVAADRLVDDMTIERLLVRTRERVLEMIATSSISWTLSTFPRDMVDAGFVAGVRDRNGAMGYAAVDYPDLRLVDRVASLFIADYLTRPGDYESVIACEDCGEVSFTWCATHSPACERRTVTESGIIDRVVEDAPPRSTRLGVG